MSGRDTHNTEMLSAYLDGELSSEERQEVERKLAVSDELRQLLSQLRQLSDDLQKLPKYRLGEPVYNRILSEIEQLSQAPSSDEHELEFADELLSAYLDEELPDADRQRVELELESSPEYRQTLGELRKLRDTLQSLPTYQLDDGFADRVVRRAERETLLGTSDDDAQVTMSPEPATVAKQSRWRVYAWAAVTVAALVALAFSIPRGGNDSEPNLAGPNPKIETPDVHPGDMPDVVPKKAPEALVKIDSDVGPDGHKVTTKSPIDIKQDPQWQLVSSIQQNSRQRLILVFELAITPEGVDNAAFANLLKRHHIRFRQATPVSDEQQKSLLKHRFLQGVQTAPAKTDDMDEIQLYLLACEGRDVEAMWHDLIRRPVGIGSFFVNFTTAEAEDRVLHRICEASGVSDEVGRASKLLANFAILSRNARNLGVFGKIGWIEPSLLDGSLATPPETPDDNAPEEIEHNTGGFEPSPDAAIAGDFACELLFVVRNLEPLDAEDELDDETEQGE